MMEIESIEFVPEPDNFLGIPTDPLAIGYVLGREVGDKVLTELRPTLIELGKLLEGFGDAIIIEMQRRQMKKERDEEASK